uniref:Large ribosomal subunit protein bL28c n=1 Tax=Cyanophora biloba TaxID=1489483 RepID=A0A2Z4HGZ8_9EUKA|nr:ribosomal protein L28 [Cyanophora biloba]AWW13873.1 ribosomal protein L28 [Cyanophora biloba]
MARQCEITGKKANNGYRVSHSHRRTKCLQKANLQTKRIWSPTLKRWLKLQVSTKVIKDLKRKSIDILLKV